MHRLIFPPMKQLLRTLTLSFAFAGLFFAGAPALHAQATTPEKGGEKKKDPAMEAVEDVAGLPRVLIIGDSISIGYTVPTREALKGVANVHRPQTNCGPTTRGVENLDKWLGDGKWDVIHFNFGLHDLKYIDDAGKNVAPDKGHQMVPPE